MTDDAEKKAKALKAFLQPHLKRFHEAAERMNDGVTNGTMALCERLGTPMHPASELIAVLTLLGTDNMPAREALFKRLNDFVRRSDANGNALVRAARDAWQAEHPDYDMLTAWITDFDLYPQPTLEQVMNLLKIDEHPDAKEIVACADALFLLKFNGIMLADMVAAESLAAVCEALCVEG